ncbi:BnaC05g36890D [Brassica napus]|uniref:BnaC05g36890D protein n=1 Tax=Brassica napus TaxID=3708 RepID=A0A078I1Y2_BRANA|nr:BnaC05g36890D [Brassica napus]
MNYRLPKMAWVNVLGKSLVKPCETSSSSDPLRLHWDSTRTPTITEVLELEKINNVEVSTVIGLAEKYKHLVGATHSDDADFHSVAKVVQQGYKMRRSDWEKSFVDMFVATEDIGQQRKTKDKDAEHDEEENKDEEYQKDKEQRKDKDHSISAQDYENEEDTIDEESNSDDKKSAPDDENEEDTIAEEANSWDGRSALDDENEEETCDKKVKSCTEHLREEENILGENETTQKITQDEDTEKLESESCLKQTSQVSSPIPTFTSPKFDLLSRESHSGKGTNEVLMRDVCEIPVFQPLMKIKKRLVQQDSPVCFSNFMKEEEQQEEEDTEDDVDDGDKESENPETNEDDAEVNEENGSENPVKGSKKRGRKVNISQCIIVFQTNHHHHHIDLLNKLETRYLNGNVNLLPCFLYHVY